jgi:hypothetical protein
MNLGDLNQAQIPNTLKLLRTANEQFARRVAARVDDKPLPASARTPRHELRTIVFERVIAAFRGPDRASGTAGAEPPRAWNPC